MRLSSGQSALLERSHSLSQALSRAFPTPSLLTPAAAGIDISDSSIKWIVLSRHPQVHQILTYGEISLEQGIVTGGIVRDVSRLAEVLREVRSELGSICCAHAALPEEAAYVFSMHVPRGTSRQQTLRLIEFEFEDRVPIPPAAAIFDFSVILPRDSEADDETSVVVFPREVADAYAEAFELSGMTLLSLEIEARSIARAVSAHSQNEPITLIVDIGRARTGFAVVKHGYPIFTSTVEVGGDLITNAISQAMSLTPEETVLFKNEHGLVPDGKDTKGVEVVSGVASAIADEVARHYHYWDTRRNDRGERMTPVGKVILIGGSANLRGLPEYIAGRVHAPTELGDIWQHVAPFADYVPPIDKRQSLQYATAVGLALRGI